MNSGSAVDASRHYPSHRTAERPKDISLTVLEALGHRELSAKIRSGVSRRNQQCWKDN